MRSDQAIISGINIGGHAETTAIQAIYDKHITIFKESVDMTDAQTDPSIIWEATECLVHGIKNGHISLKEDNRTLEFYLNQLIRKISNPDAPTVVEISSLYEEKLAWDYFLLLLSVVEKDDHNLLTRSFSENTSFNEVAERLVAKGTYDSVDEVHASRSLLLKTIINKL